MQLAQIQTITNTDISAVKADSKYYKTQVLVQLAQIQSNTNTDISAVSADSNHYKYRHKCS